MKTCIPPVLIIFALVCFALVQNTQAISPPPDGGYPGGNTAEGQNALLSLTSGTYNTAVGLSSLLSLTGGSYNTGVGAATLASNTAAENTACGAGALWLNTTGRDNTATGAFALRVNTTGFRNTANGAFALFSNTTGYQNTANGGIALFYNTTGIWNTATGLAALHNNTTGSENTAVGAIAGYGITTASGNTAVGFSAGFRGDGGGNTAVGVDALFATTGSGNTAVGITALFSPHTGNNNTAIGAGALYNAYTGDDNIALGNGAGSNLRTGDNNIYIYDPGIDPESNTIRIGTVGTQTATFIAGISGTAVTGTAVVVNSSGQLGVAASSARFKDEIKPMNEASEAILALKPVTFRYKPEIDAKRAPQFGLVAEDVAKVNPDLVARDREGKPFTVRYDQVNAMLLNEFLKEHKKVEKLEANAASQQKQIKALTAGLQKVTAQLEASKPAPQVVNNNQ